MIAVAETRPEARPDNRPEKDRAQHQPDDACLKQKLQVIVMRMRVGFRERNALQGCLGNIPVIGGSNTNKQVIARPPASHR